MAQEKIITKPEKTEIKKIYWACNDNSHRHTNEIIAQNCIDKFFSRKTVNFTTREEQKKILEMRRSGVSIRKICEEMNRGAWAVRNSIKRETRREELENNYFIHPHKGLSARTSNCLLMDDLLTRDAIASAIADGKIFRIPGMGKKSVHELLEWLKDENNGIKENRE